MPRYEEARSLRFVGRDALDRRIRLTPKASQAWSAMQEAAERDGIRLILLSGYRSVARQAGILRRKLKAGADLGNILRVNAYPGYSEHHTGRALDVGCPGHESLTEDFAETSAFAWLRKHARRYGFRLSYPRHNPLGIAYEPWHWCLRP